MHRVGKRGVTFDFVTYRSFTLRFVFSSREKMGCFASRSMNRFAPPTHEETRIEARRANSILKGLLSRQVGQKSNEEPPPPVPGSLVFSRRGGGFLHLIRCPFFVVCQYGEKREWKNTLLIFDIFGKRRRGNRYSSHAFRFPKSSVWAGLSPARKLVSIG